MADKRHRRQPRDVRRDRCREMAVAPGVVWHGYDPEERVHVWGCKGREGCGATEREAWRSLQRELAEGLVRRRVRRPRCRVQRVAGARGGLMRCRRADEAARLSLALEPALPDGGLGQTSPATDEGTASLEPSGLTARQQVVLQRLRGQHRGRYRGITHDDLVLALGIPKRRLREALQALVVEHGQPVGSHPVHGVYLCEDARDFALAQECLWQEALPTMRRRGALVQIQQATAARAAGASARQEELFAGGVA